jgi:hypothetical protein
MTATFKEGRHPNIQKDSESSDEDEEEEEESYEEG